jgi:hypothetical protein
VVFCFLKTFHSRFWASLDEKKYIIRDIAALSSKRAVQISSSLLFPCCLVQASRDIDSHHLLGGSDLRRCQAKQKTTKNKQHI